MDRRDYALARQWLASPLRRLHRFHVACCGRRCDPQVRQLSRDAWDAVHRLTVALHYASCPGGVCRESDGPAEDWNGVDI